MQENNKKFRIVDALLILMMVLPLVAAMVIKILTNEPDLTGGVSIAGARIFFTVPMPIQDLIITEAQINAWLILITILGACLFFTHGIREDKRDWRQMAAEWVVEKLDGLVEASMEELFRKSYAPFIKVMNIYKEHADRIMRTTAQLLKNAKEY